MGNYHPISIKTGTQTKKNMLKSKITKAEVQVKFQDDRSRHFGNSSDCYKMGIYHPILMKIGTQTKKPNAEFKNRRNGSLRQKTEKIKCKIRYLFKRATLYEREVV
jgi:hypothetical protein